MIDKEKILLLGIHCASLELGLDKNKLLHALLSPQDFLLFTAYLANLENQL